LPFKEEQPVNVAGPFREEVDMINTRGTIKRE
jgi:hypothetical protein